MANPRSAFDRAFLLDHDGHGELVLVRHAQQRFDPPAADPPLTELGLQQAERVADHLAGASIDAVYTSELERAMVTGSAIASRHGHEIVTMATLDEVRIRRGSDVTDEEWAAAGEAWISERRWDLFPGAERSAAFRGRIVEAVDAIVASHPTTTVAVVCHGGVINAYLAHHLGVAPDMFFRPAHASVHRVAHGEGRLVIHTLNEIHHLDGVLTW